MELKQFHPAAREAIELHARRVLASAERESGAREPSRGFSPDFFAKLTLTEKDIVGPLVMREGSKEAGNLSLSIADPDAVLTLKGRALEDFDSLLDRLFKVPWIETALSREWIANNVLNWMLQQEKESPEEHSYVEYLASAMAKVVRQEEIWVPIAGLSIESSFEIAGLPIHPLTQASLDRWWSQLVQHVPPESQEGASAKFKRLRERTQGYCAVVVKTESERGRGIEMAREAADRAIGLLRIFLPESASPSQTIVCRPLGQEYQPSFELLVERDGELVGRHSGILGNRPGWVTLSNSRLEQLSKFGLTEGSKMLRSDTPTEFQSTLMRSLAIYSRVSISISPLDKLVFLLAALETLLLETQTEPIQSTVGDRLAFFLARAQEERRKIVLLTRESYGARSRYLHHGSESIPQEGLTEFFRYCWMFFHRVTRMNQRWATRAELIETLNQVKYS